MVEKNRLIFNDYALYDLIWVGEWRKGLNIGRALNADTRVNRRGISLTGYNSSELIIETPIYFKEPVQENRRKLEYILNVDEPKRLYRLNDEDTFEDGVIKASSYYMAIPVGAVSLSETSKFAEGVIQWLIPDGISYSTDELNFTNLSSGNNPGQYITVNNPGTAPMDLELNVTFKSDCGYFAVQSETGDSKLLFGSIEEPDGETYEKSDLVLSTTDFKDWTPGTSTAQDPNKKATLTMTTEAGLLGTLSGTMGKEGTAQVSVMERQLDPDSNGDIGAQNFYSWVRIWFETAQMGQTGTSSICFVATDGSLIAAYIIEKIDKVGNRARVCFVTGDAPKVPKKEIAFTPAYWKSANPWTSRQGDGTKGGPWDITKEGGKVTFYWWGSKFSYPVPSLADKVLDHVEFVAGQWNGRGLDRQKVGGLVTGMHLAYMKVVKLNVSAYRNTPNKFADGDKLIYGRTGESHYATLNGLQSLALRDPKSTTIVVPPGESVLYLSYSDYATTPLVELKGRVPNL